MICDPVALARDALDRVAAARPKLDGAALTEATTALCLRRDTLRHIATKGPGARRELATLNALVSLVQAVHYPLDAVPWALLEQARAGLDALGRTAADR